MKCPNPRCRREIDDDSIYCEYCGRNIAEQIKINQRRKRLVSVIIAILLGGFLMVGLGFYIVEETDVVETINEWFASIGNDDDTSLSPYCWYRVKEKTYFYDSAYDYYSTRKYVIEGDLVYIEEVTDGRGYTEFTNSNGITTKGWLDMDDLELSY